MGGVHRYTHPRGTLVGIFSYYQHPKGTLVGIYHIKHPKDTLVGINHCYHTRKTPWWVYTTLYTPREAERCTIPSYTQGMPKGVIYPGMPPRRVLRCNIPGYASQKGSEGVNIPGYASLRGSEGG